MPHPGPTGLFDSGMGGLSVMREVRSLLPSEAIAGMGPAVKAAVAATRNGRVGVLTTTVTRHGECLASLLRRYTQGVEVFSLPSAGLVERVEAGHADTAETEAWLRHLLVPLVEARVDALVLGSTYYPFLRPAIQRIVGPEVAVIDTGQAVARQTRRILEEKDLLNPNGRPARETFYTSGEPAAVGAVLAQLWGRAVPLHSHD